MQHAGLTSKRLFRGLVGALGLAAAIALTFRAPEAAANGDRAGEKGKAKPAKSRSPLLNLLLARLTPDQRAIVIGMIESGLVTEEQVLATGGDLKQLRRLFDAATEARLMEDAVLGAAEAGYLPPAVVEKARNDRQAFKDAMAILANAQLFDLPPEKVRQIATAAARRGGEEGRKLGDRLVVQEGVKECFGILLPPNAFDAMKGPQKLIGALADLQAAGLDQATVTSILSDPVFYDRVTAVGYTQALLGAIYSKDPQNGLFDPANGNSAWKKVGDHFERSRSARDRLRELAKGGVTGRPGGGGTSGKSTPQPGTVPGFGRHAGSGKGESAAGGGGGEGQRSSSGAGSSSSSRLSLRVPGGYLYQGDVFERAGATGGATGADYGRTGGTGTGGSGGGSGGGTGAKTGGTGGSGTGGGTGSGGGSGGGTAGGGGGSSGTGGGTGGGTGSGTGSGGTGGTASGGGSSGGSPGSTGSGRGSGSGSAGTGTTSAPASTRSITAARMHDNGNGTYTVYYDFSDGSTAVGTYNAKNETLTYQENAYRYDDSGEGGGALFLTSGTADANDPALLETSEDPESYRSERVSQIIAGALADIARMKLRTLIASSGARVNPADRGDAIPYRRGGAPIPVRKIRGLLVGDDRRGGEGSSWRSVHDGQSPQDRDKGDVDPADPDQR